MDVTLKAWAESDFVDFKRLITMPQITENGNVQAQTTAAQQRMFDNDRRQPYQTSIRLDNQIIGSIIAYPVLTTDHTATTMKYELSYFLDPAYWGNHIMTNAINVFIKGLPVTVQLQADVLKTNIASQKVLVNNHFQLIDTYVGFDGQIHRYYERLNH